MNNLEKVILKKQNEKLTENGDKAYKSTGDNLTDLFFMTPYFEKHLDEAQIGDSEKEKVFAMFMRDPRFGLGRRDLGRSLMRKAKVSTENIVKAGRFDDLLYIPSNENLEYWRKQAQSGNELAKKWLPRLTGKDSFFAKLLCKEWKMTEKEYRALIKVDSTTEYKLSYAEKDEETTPLNDLFKKGNYKHPLVNEIEFDKVPSLAMTKYLHTFSTREDIKPRFDEYIQAVKENKAKVNVKTANVHDALKVGTKSSNTANDVISSKIVDNATLDVELNCIPILDTSGSMYSGWGINFNRPNDIGMRAMSVAYALATKSTYAKNQIISFSSRPKLMTIKGETMKDKYESMYTGDCSNTDFGAVMDLLSKLKTYPEYLVVLSDMEFDCGSNQSKAQTMKIFKEHGANTKIIWWNFNDRSKTSPEWDEYGNIFLSGYNIQILKLLENKFDMSDYIDKVLKKYSKDIGIKYNG
jgi:hypothetical protein